MNKTNPEWKIELISELRKERLKNRVMGFIEIVYSTLLPVVFTFLFFTKKSAIYLTFILFIIIFRIKKE